MAMSPAAADLSDVTTSDVVVIGAGVAGLSAALGLAPHRVTLLTKGRLGSSGSSPLAQGGVAAALGPDDAPELHARDTLEAGGGLCEPAVVEILTGEAASHIERLATLGTRFDRDTDGRFALGREAAHGRSRILHANGDGTGAEVVRALGAAVGRAEHVRLEEDAVAEDLLVTDGRVGGVFVRRRDGSRVLHLARSTVVATGGTARLWRDTTNPVGATGDGLAMAARAGAVLTDLEFVQFHPTALDVGADPLPLVTEALRGQGAVLVDERGLRFLVKAHPAAELAPRDVVARATFAHAESGHKVFLDARAAIGDRFPSRFPTVFELCRRHGVDPRREPIPVTPAAHYHMGGVSSDDRGRSSLPALWVCGEAASTGVHGANRLASNSLLEALVFGGRVADDIRVALDSLSLPTVAEVMRSIRSRATAGLTGGHADVPLADRLVQYVRSLMWRNVGLVRTETGLRHALRALEAASFEASAGDARNAVLVARLLTIAALVRKESRGGHFRADFPDSSPHEARRRHLQLRRGDRVELVGSFEPFQLPTAKVHATVSGHASTSPVFRLQR
jgi:L-aspartate oxidase